MTALHPINDRFIVYSATLASQARTSPYYLVKSVLRSGIGVNVSFNGATGAASLAFDTTWGDARYAPATVFSTTGNGLAPASVAADGTKVLRNDGAWSDSMMGSFTVAGTITSHTGAAVDSNALALDALYKADAPTSNIAGYQFKKGGALRWAWVVNADPETGAQAGSNLELQRFDDTGAVLPSLIKIGRASGTTQIMRDFTIGDGTNASRQTSATIDVGAGQVSALYWSRGSAHRWRLKLTAVELGSDSGGDLEWSNYYDSGSTALNVVLRMTRSNGELRNPNGLFVVGDNTANVQQAIARLDAPSNRVHALEYMLSSNTCWRLGTFTVNTNYIIRRHDSTTGAYLDDVLSIATASGDVTITHGLTVNGSAVTSDERTKTDIEAIPDDVAIEWSKRLSWCDFTKINETSPDYSVTQAGLIAQAVQSLSAETGYGAFVVHEQPDTGYLALDYNSVLSIVNKGLQTRLARIEAHLGM